MLSVRTIAFMILLIGGINWLFVGLFSVDLIAAISQEEVGYRSIFSRILYVIVGLSALYCLKMFSSFTRNSGRR